MSQIPNVTEDEERRFLTEYRTHPNPQQRHKVHEIIWLAYGKLVVLIASCYRFKSLDMRDLIGVGFLGLHAAIAGFDLGRPDLRFAAYAVPCINHQIQSYLRKNLKPVAPPDSRAYNQLIRCSHSLLADAAAACARESVSPTRNELCRRVAARVGLSEHEVEYTRQLLESAHVSLDDEQEVRLASRPAAVPRCRSPIGGRSFDRLYLPLANPCTWLPIDI